MRNKRTSARHFILLTLFLFLALISFGFHSVSAKNKPSSKNSNTDPFDKDAITTSLKDAYPSARWIENFDRYFKNYGSIKSLNQLTTGLNRIELKSYCLKPGVPVNNPNTYSYVLGPLKGTKAKLLTEIVKRAAKHKEIEHKFVQTLIWGIIAGISYSDYPEDFAKKISPLLPDEEKNKKSGTSLKELMKLPVSNEIKAQLSIITDLRSLISSGINRFEDLERIAVPNTEAVVTKNDVKIDENCWTLTEDGYYVRPKPGHYSKTKLDVYKPEEVSINYDDKGRISKMSSVTGVLEFEYDENAGADVITYPTKNSYRINRIEMVKLDGEPIGKIGKMLWYAEQDFQTTQTSPYKRKEIGIVMDPLEETFKSRDAKIKQLFEYFTKYNGGKKLSKEEEKEMYALKQIEYSMKFVLDTLRFQVTKEEMIEKVLRIATDASVERFTGKASTHSLKSGGRTEALFDMGMTVAVPGNNAQRIGVTGSGSEETGDDEDPPIRIEPDPPIGRDTSRTLPNCRIVLKQVDMNLLPGPEQLFMVWFEAECDKPIKEIEWNLFDVSKEQGSFMNDKNPEYYKPTPDKDLTIDVSENSYYTITDSEVRTIAKGSGSAPHYLFIKSHDYGASGKLSVTIKVDGVYFQATCDEWTNNYINIPYDMDNNRIADKWELDNFVTGYPPNWDEDPIPGGQATNGDGMTNYEEYRGFSILTAEGIYVHKRMDPTQKEMFIIDPDLVISISAWKNLTGITIYRLTESLVYGNRAVDDILQYKWVNFCRGYARGEKYCIKVEKAPGMEDPYGEHPNIHVMGYCTIGVPRTVSRMVLFPLRIKNVLTESKILYTNMLNENPDSLALTIGGVTFRRGIIQTVVNWLHNEAATDYFASFMMDQVSLHELGHGSKVNHHSGGTHTGDSTCIMRYYYMMDNGAALLTLINGVAGAWVEGVDLTDEEKMYVFTSVPYIFCRTPDNCWGQVNINDRLP